jgi:peptidoglycan/xylan/chitin deacetylase (PgdA/CDA1 family)
MFPASNMKRLAKSVLFFVLYYSGIEWILARLIRPRAVAILMYHGVCDQAALPPEINFHLPREEFEQQMRALKSRYRVISLDDVAAHLRDGKPLEKAVVITFDDGYRNNALYAAPILKQSGFPYTVYVATAYVESRTWIPLNQIYWLWSEKRISSEQMRDARKRIRGNPSGVRVPELAEVADRSSASSAAEESFAMLTWKELEGMASEGAAFGSHTHTHCNMAIESNERQREELNISKSLLESHLNAPVRSFAYPYGKNAQMSAPARENIMRSGYSCALSAENGLATGTSDRFSLPRLGYERPIWRFTGEILYQFAKQAWRDRRRKAGR